VALDHKTQKKAERNEKNKEVKVSKKAAVQAVEVNMGLSDDEDE
jgi:hypothetical protein